MVRWRSVVGCVGEWVQWVQWFGWETFSGGVVRWGWELVALNNDERRVESGWVATESARQTTHI